MEEKQDHAFEETHVQQVYAAIASHFSATRYKRWPIVEDFISRLSRGSFGCDFGCGNGKNLSWDPSQAMILGLDACEGLLRICNEKGFETARGNVLKDPFRPGIFDFALSIAVIHHLRTPERRVQAIQEMLRVLRPGGSCLIFVWALEDNASVRRHKGLQFINEQDVLVPWNLKEDGSESQEPERFNRYYHLFRKGELEELILATGGGTIERSGYDRDNWFVIFRKHQ